MKPAKRLLLALLGPLLVLGGAELALRLAGAGHSAAYFVPAEINGRQVWIDNPFFGYRFFAPRLARTPPGAVIDREKAPGTIRVFVLGESAAMAIRWPSSGRRGSWPACWRRGIPAGGLKSSTRR